MPVKKVCLLLASCAALLIPLCLNVAAIGPNSDQSGICYVFCGEKLRLRMPCVLSSGFGAGGSNHVGLHWPNGKTTLIYSEPAGDSVNVFLNGKPAEEYERDGAWLDVLDPAKQNADDPEPLTVLSCVRRLKSCTSYCYAAANQNRD